MSTRPQATPVALIPALLCDEQLYLDMITVLGNIIEPLVLHSPKPKPEDSVADILRALTMPTLVLWGVQDAPAPLAVGEALAAALPRAQFEVLQGCGHLPTLEKPEESAAMFTELLKPA